MTNDARRSPIFGAEPWTTAAGVEWSHFDWWFALVITTDFDGDPGALRTQLETTLRSSLHRRDDTQAKLSHLADLRAVLTRCGWTSRTWPRSRSRTSGCWARRVARSSNKRSRVGR